MKIWRIIAHHEDTDGMIAWSKKVGRVAVGWVCVGDLRKLPVISYEEIRERLRLKCPGITNVHTGSPSLWNFWNIEVGDLVIISGGHRGRSHVIKIVGDYIWESKQRSFENYRHQRAAVITDHDPDELWSRVGGVAKGQSIRWTVALCKK